MRGRRAISAGVSVAMLVPVVTLTAMLLVATMMQAELSQRAAANAANLRAEEGKKLLKLSALRGPSNESLVNLYAAGKLPINVDYLLAVAADGTVLAERSGAILTLNPGDNVTLRPGQLDPRLAVYDGDFWRMKREVRELLLHTSDGNTYYLSWGPWGGFVAATFTTNTATTATSTTRTTSTYTISVSVIRTIYMPTTRTVTYVIRPSTTTTRPPIYFSMSCTASATYVYEMNAYRWYNLDVSCSVSVSNSAPSFTYTLQVIHQRTYEFPYYYSTSCTSSGTSSSRSFAVGCGTQYLYVANDYLNVWFRLAVRGSDGQETTAETSCRMSASISSSYGTASCSG